MNADPMRIAKYVGGTAVLVVAALLYVTNFSGVESRLECSGKNYWKGKETGSGSITVHVKLVEHRLSLWSDSYAAIWVERSEPSSIDYFGRIKREENMLLIYGSDKEIAGFFSYVTKTFSLGGSSYFEGVCNSIPA